MEPKQHLSPVWREKANFLIMAKFQFENEEEYIQEQLWTKQLSINTFEICCIPFFVYDISLGDIVSTNKDKFVVDVIRSSGRSTFRVWFGDSDSTTIKNDVLNNIKTIDGLPEWYSENLLAIDVSTLENAKRLMSYLQEQENNKLLNYEIGKLFQS